MDGLNFSSLRLVTLNLSLALMLSGCIDQGPQALEAALSSEHFAKKKYIAPVANAGTDQHAPKAFMIVLNGNGSVSANGESLRYLWKIKALPQGSSATLKNPTSPQPTFITDKAGSYKFALTVTDAEGDTDRDEVTILAV